MNYIKKFENFLREAAIMADTETETVPDVKPAEPIVEPDKPTEPKKPTPKRITIPKINPGPKFRKKKVNEQEVADRFLTEIKKRGETLEDYKK